MRIPRTITVLVDSREKRPLLFPKTVKFTAPNGKTSLIQIKTERAALPEGDYTLKLSGPTVAIVERKGSVREICGNFLTKDFPRALSAFQRLAAACPHPILFLDMNISDFFPVDQRLDGPERALCKLLYLASRLHLQVIFGGTNRAASRRRRLGALVVHLLLSYQFPEEIY